ncbi:hypothetical protein [Paraflavitalea sp. CAU 1676]|uniref:hypothetical protein n=1 Tax=Paraflavitalea sp. CAU 1676 TaxID=3032598 RepID=UPI0023DA2A1C|nr:hypothetical protein [Paraflavitalea sp. CAU 1676]MDF2189232.1 hypothetical protein [Paraflavitalea sp. CAU 1676]
MSIKVSIVFSFLLVVIGSCAPNRYDINRYKRKFEEHRSDFDSLVSLLKTQNLQDGPPVNVNNLPDNIQRQLAALEVFDISVSFTGCTDTAVYEFTSSWSSKAALHFSWDLCDKDQASKGYHGKSGEMIEVWGMGDGWIMWIDSDFY